ncbi:MAG: hypothetical protein HY810_01130 [Candidatus Omnitrophica bacterium]|nr:hypothetical protein [Candidatus Omnitrophota bacterium]
MKAKKNGSVLISALIVAIVVSIAAASMLTQGIASNRVSERAVDSAQTYYLTEAAIERAIYELKYGQDIIDDDGNSGSNGIPDIYEQLQGINSFNTAEGGAGPITAPPLAMNFTINGQAVNVELSTILVPHSNLLETFNPATASGGFVQFTGGCYGKPLFLDINGDGNHEILLGTDDGNVHYYKYYYDEINKQYTIEEVLDAFGDPFINGLEGKIVGSLIAQDIDNDGNINVLINTDKGHVYCYEVGAAPLELRWDYDVPGANSTYWELAVGNLDGDADLEIVMPSANKGLTFLDTNGSVIRNIAPTGFGYTAPPLIGDFDKDGVNEVIADDGVELNCYELSGTKKWTYRVGLKTSEATGALSIDGSGKHIEDQTSNGFWVPSSSAGDVDGDGFPEIVATSLGNANNRNTHTVILRDNNRTIVDAKDINKNGNSTEVIAVPDDIRVNLTPSALANGFTGADLRGLVSQRQPAIGDLEADGKVEIAHGARIDQIFLFNVDFDNTDGAFLGTAATETDVGWNKGTWEMVDYTGDGAVDFPAGLGGAGDIAASPVFANVDKDQILIRTA